MYKHILHFTDRASCEQAEDKLQKILSKEAEIEGMKESGLDAVDCVFFTPQPLVTVSRLVIIHETQPASYNFNDLQA